MKSRRGIYDLRFTIYEQKHFSRAVQSGAKAAAVQTLRAICQSLVKRASVWTAAVHRRFSPNVVA
jgi:hypothetical protein